MPLAPEASSLSGIPNALTSMFMPRLGPYRPVPVPTEFRELGVSQFVEIPDKVVFTMEHSVRASKAACQLIASSAPSRRSTRHDKSISALIYALEMVFV